MVRKLKGTRDFKIIKRMSQKAVHEYWSNWFWQCEPGLGPGLKFLMMSARPLLLISKKLPRGAFWIAVLKTILFLSFSILTEKLFS